MYISKNKKIRSKIHHYYIESRRFKSVINGVSSDSDLIFISYRFNVCVQLLKSEEAPRLNNFLEKNETYYSINYLKYTFYTTVDYLTDNRSACRYICRRYFTDCIGDTRNCNQKNYLDDRLCWKMCKSGR